MSHLPKGSQQESSGIPPEYPRHPEGDEPSGQEIDSNGNTQDPPSHNMGCVSGKGYQADDMYEKDFHTIQGQVQQGHHEPVKHNRTQEGQRGHPGQRRQVHSVQQVQQTGQKQSQSKSTGQPPTRRTRANSKQTDHREFKKKTTHAPKRPAPLPPRVSTSDGPRDPAAAGVRGPINGVPANNDLGSSDDSRRQKIKPTTEEVYSREKMPQRKEGEKKIQVESGDPTGQHGRMGESDERRIGGQTIKPTTREEYEDKVKAKGHDKHDQRQVTEIERKKNKEWKGNKHEDENQDGDDPASDENGKSKKDELKTDSVDDKEWLKEQFIEENFEVRSSGKLKIYQAKLKKVFKDKDCKLRKMELGQNTPTIGVPQKILMLVGATGSGKSTMIDAILNFIFGVQWSDDYRLKLVPDETPPGQKVNQAVSQTQWITAYTIHYQPWFTHKLTLTIIDTPGFGDTRGIKRDQEIVKQIRNFFRNGINHLNVVGLVTQASSARLDNVQRYIFDSILSIFGKDIQENIFMLLTFADGKKPQVLSGLAEANMQYEDFYKFNNSALFTGASSQDDDSDGEEYDKTDDNFGKKFWRLGENNFTKFMNDMETKQEKSLTQTRDVLKKRHQLEITISSINERIKERLKKLEELDTQQKLLKQHEADVDRNKHFSQQTEKFIKEKQYMRNGEYATMCQDCEHNCHYPCNCGYDLKDCKVFEYNSDYCNNCPKKCGVRLHKSWKYKYVEKRVKTVVESSEIKQKYEEALGKTLSAKALIKCCNEDFEAVKKETSKLIEDARECLVRLDEIALKPNPLSTTDYIDLMIQEEEFLKQPGWRETVKQLQEVKKQANDLLQLAQTGYKENSKGKAKATDEAAEAGKMSETTI